MTKKLSLSLQSDDFVTRVLNDYEAGRNLMQCGTTKGHSTHDWDLYDDGHLEPKRCRCQGVMYTDEEIEQARIALGELA